MSGQTASAPQRDPDVRTRLGGPALFLFRVLWVVTAIVVTGILGASLVAAFTSYQSPDQINLPALQARNISPLIYAGWFVWQDLFFFAVCFAIAALIFWRKSDDPMALFVSFTLLLFGGAFFVTSTDVLAQTYPALSLPIALLALAGFLCFIVFLCVFPSGRFAPGWLRWLALAFAVFRMATAVPFDVRLDPNAPPLLAVPEALERAVTIIFSAIIAGAQIYRYRRISNPVERQQTKWVVLGIVIGLGGYFCLERIGAALVKPVEAPDYDPLADMIFYGAIFGFMLLVPLSIGVAILQARLYDIDFIIRRTLVYGVLTAALALVYALCLFGLQSVLLGLTGQTGSGLILTSGISALAIAALSRPLRRRIQDWIDQRFYRRRYDAAQVIAAYGAYAQEEVDADRLTSRLIAVARDTMQPQLALLWTVRGAAQLPAGPGQPDEASQTVTSIGTSIGTDDPLAAHFRASPSAVAVSGMKLNSPALDALRQARVEVALPLLAHGELIAVLGLGAHRSGQVYSLEDYELLNALAAEAAPAMRAAQLLREQRLQEQQRARLDQEMQLARDIQHSLLPKTMPALAGWSLDALYQPAREVGGDFYDFIPLSDGQLGIAIGDVTGKGMPAALLMASTRTMLRATAQTEDAPGEALARVNALLCRNIPPGIFVTCLYVVLDPVTGHLRYANAGHDLPYCWHGGGAQELRARGMPLGLMPESRYEENQATLSPGERMLFYTDGITEAHGPRREMFGFPRLKALAGQCPEYGDVNAFMRAQLTAFTGADWEQEDDITLVTLSREARAHPGA